MAVQKVTSGPGKGTTTLSGPDSLASQIDWSDPQNPKLPGYQIAINPDGGIEATKNNGFYDVGVPILIGSIFALGAAGVGAGAGAGASASAGAGSVASDVAGVENTIYGGGMAAEAGRGVFGKIANAAGPAIAAGINQYTQDAGANRGTKLTYGQEQERLRQNAEDNFQRELIQREAENRTATKDAANQLQTATYNMNRKAFTPPTIHSNVAGVKDYTLPNFGIGRTDAPTADETTAYQTIAKQASDRLKNGSPLPPLTDPTQQPFYTQPNPNLNPGTMERIGQIAGPAVSIWDKISKFL